MCKTTTPSSIFLTANGGRPVLKPFVGGLGLGERCYVEKPTVKQELPKRSEPEYSTGRWTKKEHEVFLEGLKEMGKNWREISLIMKTRSPVQVRTHAQKFFLKMARTQKKLNGDGKDIGLEYTSLKKHTAVLSSCLADVPDSANKYEYEVMLPGTVPNPVSPVKTEKSDEVKSTDLTAKKVEAVEEAVPAKTVQQTAVKQEENEPLQSVEVSNAEACIADSNEQAMAWLAMDSPGYSSESSSFEDTYSLSSDYDSAGLEEGLFDDVPGEAMFGRTAQDKGSISLDGFFVTEPPSFGVQDEDDMSYGDSAMFEMEDPLLPVPFKRKITNALDTKEQECNVGGSTWKRPRAVLDTV